MEAPAEHVERAIRSGGLARQKTRSIQAVLRAIQANRGRLSLEFLRRLSMDEARVYLLALPGVGPKTAACVLLFHLGRPALPVDTHVYRVSWRLGLIPENATAEDAHGILEPACPPGRVYAFHVLLIRHGRRICKARNPRCRECILAGLCPSAVSAGSRASSPRRSPLRRSNPSCPY
jgi:endonuclease-3